MLPTPPEGLRHWRLVDAPALEAAWRDPTITSEDQAPPRRSAASWIAGVEERWERGLALDLVIEPPDGDPEGVAGEVGLAHFTRAPARAELGVWVTAPQRRRGIASRAVETAATWALSPAAHGGLGLDQVWARTDATDDAARALFRRLGWRPLGTHATTTIWAVARSDR